MAISSADLPAALLRLVVRALPAASEEWGKAMVAELAHIQQPAKRWSFSLSCVRAALSPSLQARERDVIEKQFDKVLGNLWMPALLSALLLLPFALIEFLFDISPRLSKFTVRNGIDLAVVFTFLWIGLTAIFVIVAPFVRHLRAGNRRDAGSARASGSPGESVLHKPVIAAIVSLLLALPFMTMLTLLVFNIEPPLGPLASVLKNPDPDQPNIAGSLVVLFAFLLAVFACAVARAPIVRTLRSGGNLLAHPANLVLGAVILSCVAGAVFAIFVDQVPCWAGIPNCD